MSQELQLGKYEFHPYEFKSNKDPYWEVGLMEALVRDNLDRLLSIGFTLIGRWKLVDERPTFDLFGNSNDDNVLYAFVVDGEPVYVGKTIKGLKRRLLNDRNAHSSQLTNTRNQKRILECLLRNQTVEIYVLPDNGLLKYGDFQINLAAGLEDSLINELNPSWNGGLKETEDETLAPINK